MFSENVTFFVYIGYMSLAWGLVFAAALLLARFVKTWLINALVRSLTYVGVFIICSSNVLTGELPCNEGGHGG